MKEGFKGWVTKQEQTDDLDQSPLLQQQKEKFHKLESLSPDAAALFDELSDPNLPRQEFFKKAKDFNAAHPGVAEGMYDELSFYPFTGRHVRIKIFAGGLISFSVYDEHTEGSSEGK